ncbi:MAG: imidazole glycerol phosphate synthase subunit HisF [Clostridiales bacterium]|jgi:cyclase|nr:imidazole glycerol phosphate synthase subunit HisF [Clostridiales bacterium]
MLSKRLIACLDIRNGNLAKSIKFVNTKEIGDAVEAAGRYYADGADELVFYDINASFENRDILIDTVNKVANQVFIPFSVGGGLRTLDDCIGVILAGAEKIHLNSNAVKNPTLISEVARRFGVQCMILSTDVLRMEKSARIKSGFEIVINGGRTRTGLDALEWIKKGVDLGAGEVVLNAIDADGTLNGYDIELTRLIADSINVPVVASGGAGSPEHIKEVLTDGGADAALVSSIIHYKNYTLGEIKDYLNKAGVKVRL